MAPKVCLITGASRGIGHATALALANSGWRLALTARTTEPLVELVRATDCENLALRCDVTDEASVAAAVAETVGQLGRLDAVVCAAGVAAFGPTPESSLDDFRRQIDTNLTGTYLTCREALKVMLPQRSGHLVTVLSVASKATFPNAAGYIASKWGAYGLTRSLAEEVRRDGVRVTALLPGSVDTPLWDSVGGAPFPREDMLTAASVAETIRWILETPPGASVDELHLMPPKGIL